MAQDDFAARMPSIGFNGQAPAKGRDQELMMALRKDSAQRPAPKEAPAPAAAKRATNQPSLMQALEMTGLAPDAPNTPGDPQPGGAAMGQSAELGGGAGGEVSVTDMLQRVTADMSDVDEDEGKRPSNASEQRRQPKIEAEVAAQRDMVLAIVARAASALSINPGDVDVQVDAEGGPAADAGTRGLQMGKSVFLDGGSFDPGSIDGAQLITHEVIHQAQRGLPGMGDDPIGMAEAEATMLAERFVRGGGMLPVQAGLPGDHAAAENGGGADVSALIEQYKATIEANAQTVTPIPESPSGGGGTATQNRASKVRQYTDGVDGIADQISGLAAFDELCDQLGTFGDGETAGPLASIKSSGPYRELCRMWQGAKEGGEDSGTMKAAFDNEFDDRGFWGSTEDAFDLVQAAAKRDARPEAEADAARSEADAASEGVAEAESALAGPSTMDMAAGLPGAMAPAAPAIDPRTAELMGASVDEAAPDLGSFAELSNISDDQIDAIMGQSRHFDAFSERSAGGEFQSRAEQVFETLGENALGGMIQGGSDTLLDGLVFDQIGFLGDQGLKLLTRGKLGTPMIGPIIGLVQAPPWKASSWGSEQAGAAFDSFGQMGETWAGFESAQDPLDYVGVFCALLADLFEGLRDLLDAIATFCGTLSAMCYVIGGLLILFGIALLWLAGVGAPLITAGGWLTRAGSILGRINSALGPIVLALSAIGLFFRTLSALMVPADMYANQLADVGSAAGTFGEKAGAKVADTAVGAVNERIQGPIASRVDASIEQGRTGDDSGGNADADSIVRDLEDADTAVREDLADNQPDPDADRPVDADADADADRPRDDAEPDTSTPRGRFRAFVDRASARLRATELATAIRDLDQLRTDPRQAAMEGLSPHFRGNFEDKLDRRLREKTAALESLRTELASQGEGADAADRARLQRDIDGATTELTRLRTQLEDTRVAIADAEAAEAAARRDRAAADDEDDATRTQDEEAAHLRTEEQRLTQEGAALQADLDRVHGQLDERRPAVQERVTAIQAEIERLREQRATAQEGVDAAQTDATRAANERRTELQGEVDRLLREMSEGQDQAARLETQADGVDRAATLRTEADTAARQAETAQAQADGLRSTLEGRVGQRIQLTDPEGRNANGLISRKVVGFTDTGVIIAEGREGTQRTVPFAEIARPNGFRDAAQSYGEATAQANTAQQAAQQTRTQADGLDPTGADAAALRVQAQQHRDGALGLQGVHAAAERAAQGDTTPDTARERVRTAETAVGTLDTDLQGHQTEIDGLNGEITTLANEETRLAGEVRTNTAAITTTQEGIRTAETNAERNASVNSNHGLMQGSTGNATGGIGSSNAVWGEWFMQRIGATDRLISLAESAGADVTGMRADLADGAKDDPSTGAIVSAAAVSGLGIEIETEDQLRAIGARRARIENLLNDGPPSDPAQLTARRQSALDAFEQYQLAHARAYRAFVAEQIVDQHAAETAVLAESGAPIVERSQSMTEPLNTAASTEADRTSQLSAGGGEVTASGEPAGGIVGELITRLADSGDALSDSPAPPDAEAGNQIDSGQELAANENTERTAQGADASTQQRAFIDAAIQARAQQEDQVNTDITALEDKHAAELAIKEQIQQQKAQALIERDTHAQTAEQEARSFNSDFQALQAWRARYGAAAAAAGGTSE